MDRNQILQLTAALPAAAPGNQSMSHHLYPGAQRAPVLLEMAELVRPPLRATNLRNRSSSIGQTGSPVILSKRTKALFRNLRDCLKWPAINRNINQCWRSR